jgi:mannose-6-phosphate isomerase-like protein (cupin superfamily)
MAEERETQMATPFTHKNLGEVKDAAVEGGFGEFQEAHFANEDLDAERTGLSFHRVKPGKRQAFGHHHDQAEEIYVVLSGAGRVKLDDEIVELAQLDAIRVSPEVTRAFEAGPDGLELIACGQRHKGDGEILPGWWSD